MSQNSMRNQAPPPMDAARSMGLLERDAFEARAYVEVIQCLLNVAAALLGAVGISFFAASLVPFVGHDAIQGREAQLAVGLAILLWAPMALLAMRLGKSKRRRSIEREFREFLDDFPETASQPVVWSKVNYAQKEMDNELNQIVGNPERKQRVISAFALLSLRPAVHLVAVGIALASVCTFAASATDAGLVDTLKLIAWPGVAAIASACCWLLDSRSWSSASTHSSNKEPPHDA